MAISLSNASVTKPHMVIYTVDFLVSWNPRKIWLHYFCAGMYSISICLFVITRTDIDLRCHRSVVSSFTVVVLKSICSPTFLFTVLIFLPHNSPCLFLVLSFGSFSSRLLSVTEADFCTSDAVTFLRNLLHWREKQQHETWCSYICIEWERESDELNTSHLFSCATAVCPLLYLSKYVDCC